MRFRAAVLVESGQDLVLDDVEAQPLRFGQVFVKILCSGICGTQLHEIDALTGPDRFLPHLLGHEGTGDVVECGEGVTTVEVGDRVILHWRKGDGLESPTPKYKSRSMGNINAGWVTTFNEYAVVSENRLTRVPDDFDPENGAVVGCAVLTAFGALNNDARLRIGESIVILGVGGVGLSMVQGAALCAAHPIVAVDLHDSRLELARSLGATHTINSAKEDTEEVIRAAVGLHGADVVMDNTGVARLVELAYCVTHPAGRTILVGVMAKEDRACIQTYPLHFEQQFIGSSGGQCRPERDIPNYVRLCESGRLDLESLVKCRYDLEDINEAIMDLREGKTAGRCMIRMNQ